MTEPRSPLESTLDLFVYVPVGLAFTAVEEIPKLAAKGRSRLGGPDHHSQGHRTVRGDSGQEGARPPVSPGWAGWRPGGASRLIPGRPAGSSARPGRSGRPGAGEPGAPGPVSRCSRRVVGPEPPSRVPPSPIWPPPYPFPPPSPIWPPRRRARSGRPRRRARSGRPRRRARSGRHPRSRRRPARHPRLRLPFGFPGGAAARRPLNDELLAVGAYETAHRARRTVLTRVNHSFRLSRPRPRWSMLARRPAPTWWISRTSGRVAVAELDGQRGGPLLAGSLVRPDLRATLEAALEDPDSLLVVGLIDDVPVGFASAVATGPDASRSAASR